MAQLSSYTGSFSNRSGGGGSFRSGGGRMSFGGGGGRSGQYAHSVYGGPGSVKVSSASYNFSAGGGGGFGMGGSGFGSSGGGGGGSGAWAFGGGQDMDVDVTANEKMAMQNLNSRLSNYLDKVRALEKSNAELELKIRQFLEGRASPTSRDYSAYFATIAELQGKIQDAVIVNAGLYLAIDNAKLASDDFRVKYENELTMRQSVEADIAGLKRLLDELTLTRSDAEMQIENLKQDLIILKKDHEEEMANSRNLVTGNINVEVDATPQRNLMEVMEEIRSQYEAMAQKNQKELQSWFQEKAAPIKQEVATVEESIQTSKSEISTLRNTLQALQIELQSQLSMKASLEQTLAETQSRFAMKLQGLQMQVLSLEEQIQSMHMSIQTQTQEYNILLDIKSRLELEIAEYRRLLDVEGSGGGGGGGGGGSGFSKTTKVKIISEEIHDGVVVTTSSTTSKTKTESS